MSGTFVQERRHTGGPRVWLALPFFVIAALMGLIGTLIAGKDENEAPQ